METHWKLSIGDQGHKALVAEGEVISGSKTERIGKIGKMIEQINTYAEAKPRLLTAGAGIYKHRKGKD